MYYLFAINIVSFFLYGIDKYKAKKNKWRISEATLLMIAVIGGSIGAWVGMRLWHHKTMHKKFKYGHTSNNEHAGLLSGLSAHNSITMANRFITPSSTCFNQAFIREIHIIESRNGQQTIHRRL